MLADINLQLEKEDCNVKKVLTELEVLLKSPVKIGGERKVTFRKRQDSARDSGAEVSEDELEEVGGLCEGRLVDLIMTTLRKTCSLLLLSPNTDVKNVSHFVSLLSLCLARHCYQHHHKHLLLSRKQKLVSIWGSSLHLDRPSGTGKKGKHQQDVPHVPVNVNSFPISHWSAAEKAPREPRANRTPRLENTDTMKEQTESTTDSAPSKKRFSLQNESDKPDQSFHHRYSLPILEPTKTSNLVSINLDHWDNSKFLLESKDPVDDYLACSSPSVSDDLGSDADLNSRLECLCLSVTQNALD